MNLKGSGRWRKRGGEELIGDGKGTAIDYDILIDYRKQRPYFDETSSLIDREVAECREPLPQTTSSSESHQRSQLQLSHCTFGTSNHVNGS